jgi:hypothetical protein
VSALFLYRCPSTGARDAARRPRPPHLVGGQRAGHLVVMCRHAQTPLSETKHNTLWHKRIKLVTQHKESMHSPTRKGLCPIKPFLKAQLARAGVQGGGAKPPPPHLEWRRARAPGKLLGSAAACAAWRRGSMGRRPAASIAALSVPALRKLGTGPGGARSAQAQRSAKTRFSSSSKVDQRARSAGRGVEASQPALTYS